MFAVVISLGALTLAYFQFKAGRPRLKIRASVSVMVPVGQRVVGVTVRNVGGASTRVNSVSFELPAAPADQRGLFPTSWALGSDPPPAPN